MGKVIFFHYTTHSRPGEMRRTAKSLRRRPEAFRISLFYSVISPSGLTMLNRIIDRMVIAVNSVAIAEATP